MPAGPTLNFNTLRPHHHDRRLAFEELTRQLLIATPPAGMSRFEHKGPGADGGVETLVHFPDGTCWGYQTKFFLSGFGSSELTQVERSWKSALAAYPAMTRYIVGLPCNLAGSTAEKTQRKRWEAWRLKAEAVVAAKGRRVEIELWDETTYGAALVRDDPVHAGIRLYWFNEKTLTQDWFGEAFDVVRQDLDGRYSAPDHVDVRIQSSLNSAVRNADFQAQVVAFVEGFEACSAAYRDLGRWLSGLIAPEEIARLDDLMNKGEAFAGQIRALGPQATEVHDLHWTSEWVLAVLQSDSLHQLLTRDNDPEPVAATERRERAALNRARTRFTAALNALWKPAEAIDRDVLVHHRLLIVGEAGAGKSHSLAHMVDAHITAGKPGVMFLGQHFVAGDPRTEMLRRVDLDGTSFATFLGALQAAAQAHKAPALIVVDAINESHDLSVWKSNLAGLAQQVGRFDHIVLVVSCREIYEGLCLPDNLDMVRREHRGFDGDGAIAAKTYLSRHGIAWPSTPFVDPALTNPLFLSVCVRTLKEQGLTAIPANLEGASAVFRFWLEGVERSLVRKGYRRITLGDGSLHRALRAFADALIDERADALPRGPAKDLLETEVQSVPPASAHDIFLFKLLDEGVLRRDPGRPPVDETVAFTFQRFSDAFVAEALLDRTRTTEDLVASLRPGGAFHDLVIENRGRFAGAIEALMARVSEGLDDAHGTAEADFAEAMQLTSSNFLSSLRWRSVEAVTDRTVALFEAEWARPDASDAAFLDLLIQMSAIPGHRLNADYLHRRLKRMAMPERDVLLSVYTAQRMDDGPGLTLLEWAVEGSGAGGDPERARLAALVIGWMTSSSSRIVRDRASRALAALFLTVPDLMGPTFEAFADVDDAYVRERVLAAALAAATHRTEAQEALAVLATWVWDRIFNRPVVERHAFIRHYARGIIELASSVGALDKLIQIERTRPPYASAPIKHWPSEAELAELDKSASAIVSSAVGYYNKTEGRFTMPGDFGRYTMSPISEFYREARGPGLPATRAQVWDLFWSDLEARGGEVARLASESRAALEALRAVERKDTRWLYTGFLDQAPRPDVEAERKAAQARFDLADAALQSCLGPDVRILYPDHRPDDYPRFHRDVAQRWVGSRAINLGWTRERHEEAERWLGYSAGRDKHAVERIGKKYQWIAWHEVIGVLQDHYWHEGGDGVPEVLDDVLRIEELDIDLSFTGTDAARRPEGLPRIAVEESDHSRPTTAQAAIAWARTTSDLPDVPRLVEARSDSGDRWWLIHAQQRDRGYMDKLQSEGPMRTSQGAIQMVIVRADEIQMLHDRQKRERINNVDMYESGYFRDRMLGQYRAGLTGGGVELNTRADGISFGRVSRRFTPHRGSYDHGGLSEHPAFEIPRDWVLKAMDLSPAGPSQPWFVSPSGAVVLFDPECLGDATAGSIINAELLEPMLQARGYTAAWAYWGEKDGGVGSGPGYGRREGPFARETYCGLWWRDAGVWKGSLWHADGEKMHARMRDGDEY